MASKLTKMQGIPRIATHDCLWKDFNVKQGYAYGMDENGNMFVCPGSRTDNGELFIWFASDEKPVKCVYRQESRGLHSGCINGRAVIMEAGYYATPWSLCWKPSSIPMTSTLAMRIMEAKRNAKPCAIDKYRGLRHICPATI